MISLRGSTKSKVQGPNPQKSNPKTEMGIWPLASSNSFTGLLGQMKVANNTPHLAHLETKFTWVENGGKASPKDCVPRTNVAIVVPFRLD